MSWFLLSIPPVLVRSLVSNSQTEDMGPLQPFSSALPFKGHPHLSAALTPTPAYSDHRLSSTDPDVAPGQNIALGISLLSSPRAGNITPPPSFPCLFSLLEVQNYSVRGIKCTALGRPPQGLLDPGASPGGALPQPGLRSPGLEGPGLEAQLTAGRGEGEGWQPHLWKPDGAGGMWPGTGNGRGGGECEVRSLVDLYIGVHPCITTQNKIEYISIPSKGSFKTPQSLPFPPGSHHSDSSHRLVTLSFSFDSFDTWGVSSTIACLLREGTHMCFGLLGIPSLWTSHKTSQQSCDVGIASSVFWIRGGRLTELRELPQNCH